MPGFPVHISASSVLGAGYGAAAYFVGDLPPVTCVMAAGLCSVAGMMPDLDSDSGVPLKESVAFTAAVVPVMLLQRFQQFSLPLEAVILVGAGLYLAIRFGLAYLLETYSVHRGMFHSVPAALIAGQLTFLAFGSQDPLHRYFMASAVVLGFLSHLVLDEIWSVRLGLFGPKVKKSFGTAVKFYGPTAWANMLTYLLVLGLGAAAASDAAWTEKVAAVRQQMEQASRQIYTVPQPWLRR